MKKKVLTSILLVSWLTISLAACGKTTQTDSSQNNTGTGSAETSSTSSAAEYSSYLSGAYPEIPSDGPSVALTVAHSAPENSNQQKVMLALKNVLEDKSGGKIKLTIYPNGQLGSDAEVIASCLKGDIDLVYQSGSTHQSQVPETQIFDTPFLFSGVDTDKLYSVISDSEFRDIYNEANEKAGLKCLMLRACNSMNLTSNKEVTSMDDFKGLKIRTAQSESRMAIWRALGANPTPLAFSELYMALQNGTVDAQDNSLENAVTSGAAEVQKYLIPTQSMMPSLDVTMNKAKFDSLPEAYQKLIVTACKDLEKYDFDINISAEQGFRDQLLNEYHLEECELSDEMRQQMKDAAAPAIESVKEAVGNDELYAALDKVLSE